MATNSTGTPFINYTPLEPDEQTTEYIHNIQNMYSQMLPQLLQSYTGSLNGQQGSVPGPIKGKPYAVNINGEGVPSYHPSDAKLMGQVLEHAKKEQEAKILQIKADMAAQQAAANERSTAFNSEDSRNRALQMGMLGAKGLQLPGLQRPEYAQGNLFPSEIAGNAMDLSFANTLPALAQTGAQSQIAVDQDKLNRQATLLNSMLSSAGSLAATSTKAASAITQEANKGMSKGFSAAVTANDKDKALDQRSLQTFNQKTTQVEDSAFYKPITGSQGGLFDPQKYQNANEFIRDEKVDERKRESEYNSRNNMVLNAIVSNTPKKNEGERTLSLHTPQVVASPIADPKTGQAVLITISPDDIINYDRLSKDRKEALAKMGLTEAVMHHKGAMAELRRDLITALQTDPNGLTYGRQYATTKLRNMDVYLGR